MNGKTVKYRKYKGQGSGTLIVPIAIADALNWQDEDILNIVFDVRNNKKGIFIYKKEK